MTFPSPFSLPCSFGRSLSTILAGRVINPFLPAIRYLFVLCKVCCPLSEIHSTVVLEYAMWSSAREKIPSDPVAGRVRGMVVGQGSYKQKTLSVTWIWSYKRAGRWWGWSFDRGSTVYLIWWRKYVAPQQLQLNVYTVSSQRGINYFEKPGFHWGWLLAFVDMFGVMVTVNIMQNFNPNPWHKIW